MNKPLHERLKEAVAHLAPNPPPLSGPTAPHTVLDKEIRHQHADDMADYAVDAMEFRIGVRQHLERQDRALDTILAVLESLLDAVDEADEEEPVTTLDGEPVAAERDQSQPL